MELTKCPILIGFGILEGILFGLGIRCLSFVDMFLWDDSSVAIFNVDKSVKLCVVQPTLGLLKDHIMSVEQEYMRANICRDTEIDLPCTEFVPDPPLTKCDCKIEFQLKEDFKGTVTLYYELEFDQTNATYVSSKDDNQLLGKPGHDPAESCGHFRYDIDNKPIYPCGEIADSIFNDTFVLQRFNESSREEDPVPVEYTNLVSGEILKFKKPPVEVLKNFSTPINWNRIVNDELPWEAHTNLSGVENPAFRAWMDTSLKRKPVYRVQKRDQYLNGLSAGNYSFFIKMHYGVNRYNGTRTLILEAVHTEQVRRSPGWGIVLLLVATVLLLGALVRLRSDISELSEAASRALRSLRNSNILFRAMTRSFRVR